MRKLKNEELGRLTIQEYKKADKAPIVLVLDNVRSMNNVGSAFRTSDAFRLTSVCLCGITARPPHREITRTALGATESVDWHYFERSEDAVEMLRSQGFEIIAVEQTDNSIPLDRFRPEKGKYYALIFGNEVEGVSNTVVKTSDQALEIPQYGTKHSLNIAVSIGIVVWHFIHHIGWE